MASTWSSTTVRLHRQHGSVAGGVPCKEKFLKTSTRKRWTILTTAARVGWTPRPLDVQLFVTDDGLVAKAARRPEDHQWWTIKAKGNLDHTLLRRTYIKAVRAKMAELEIAFLHIVGRILCAPPPTRHCLWRGAWYNFRAATIWSIGHAVLTFNG